MSTIAYAAAARQGEQGSRGASAASDRSSLTTYIGTLAALTPAEVLAAHAAVVAITTTTVNGVVTITAVGTLFGSFVALAVLSIAFYVVGRLTTGSWQTRDWGRVLIPPLAFVAWTMAQKNTAFDALLLYTSSSCPESARNAMAVIGAVALGLAASALGDKAGKPAPVKDSVPR
jgi:hypothetical protein